MKWLGAALLVLACGAAGWGKTAAIRQRIAFLEEVTALIAHIRTQLQQLGKPLPDILDACQARTLPLQVWAKELRGGKTVLQAVEPWLGRLEPQTGRVLRELCAMLGRYDCETQTRACDHAANLLEGQAEALRKQLSEKGRLYHTVPLTLGLMAALALF